MLDKKLKLKDLKSKVENFVNERDWEQFHNPKNLAIGCVKLAPKKKLNKFLIML